VNGTPASSTVIGTIAAFVGAILIAGCGGTVLLNPTRSTANDPGGLQDTRLPAAARIVAIGDVHGDLLSLRRVLRMTGVVDRRDKWIGGKAVLVQVGDILDRGEDERAILELMRRLRGEAAAVGGRVITLIGNHEVMNAVGDFRYVTPGGFSDFDSTPGLEHAAPKAELPAFDAARKAAFSPGGLWARRIARFGVVAVVGNTLFVHGGLLPKYARYGLNRINRETRMWLLGDRRMPRWVNRADSPLWLRKFAEKDNPDMCETLAETLELTGVKRMVVAHTVQPNGPTQACSGRVWRIDVGMARAYGGRSAAIEIRGKKVRIIDRFAAATGAPAK